MDPIEKAEKDFWKIIEEEKRRRERKTTMVRIMFPTSGDSSSWLFFQGDDGADGGATAQAELAANTSAQHME